MNVIVRAKKYLPAKLSLLHSIVSLYTQTLKQTGIVIYFFTLLKAHNVIF